MLRADRRSSIRDSGWSVHELTCCLPEIDAIMADIEAAESDTCNWYLDIKPELARLQVPRQDEKTAAIDDCADLRSV